MATSPNLDCPSVRNLAGASVLVAEDEAVIALEIEALLTDAGCIVLGPYTSAADSLAALRSQRPDVALLDIKLTDGPATSVANALTALDVPFVVVTGAVDPALLNGMVSAPRVSKPYAWTEVEQALSNLLGGSSSAGASAAAPAPAVAAGVRHPS